MKKCSKCKKSKDLNCFYNKSKSKDGFGYVCKECKSDIDRQYRENNKEKLATNASKYLCKK